VRERDRERGGGREREGEREILPLEARKMRIIKSALS